MKYIEKVDELGIKWRFVGFNDLISASMGDKYYAGYQFQADIFGNLFYMHRGTFAKEDLEEFKDVPIPPYEIL